MGNKMIAVIVGIVTALVIILLFDSVIKSVYPPPAGFNYENIDMLKAYISSYTDLSKVVFLLGVLLAAVIGSIVTLMVDKTNDRRLSIIVGVLLFIQYTFNFYSIPYPLVVVVLSLLLVIPAAYLGYVLYQKFLRK